jgi:hypothetical protein
MMPSWLKNVLGALALACVLLIGSPVFAAVALMLAVGFVWSKARRIWAVRRFRRAWQPRGKDLLIVYSNSSHWQSYVEEQWLARWGHRAVVLNWSDRRRWTGNRSAEVALFRAFAGSTDFNPLGIVVPGQGRVTVRHGKEHSLRRAESALERALASATADAHGTRLGPS